jgi:hypothetical protein
LLGQNPISLFPNNLQYQFPCTAPLVDLFVVARQCGQTDSNKGISQESMGILFQQ